MILSVSRRTDIPNYYSEWFFHRIEEGFLYVRNPFNFHQISEIDLSPKVVDCIVFWTKNPQPMLKDLDKLKEYQYYFQFTLTGYGADVERNTPHKKKIVIPLFRKLSSKIGREKVIWRYDPIIFTDRYTPEYHLRAFEQIACLLHGYTNKCVISFVDLYARNKKRMDLLQQNHISPERFFDFCRKLNAIALANGIKAGSCAEEIDLRTCGIQPNSCIDKTLIEELTGCSISAGKDKSQRDQCGCLESIETGTYNTCITGCQYCYAHDSRKQAIANYNKYDPYSPLLCGEVLKEDHISRRNVKSCKETQMSLSF